MPLGMVSHLQAERLWCCRLPTGQLAMPGRILALQRFHLSC